MYSSKPSTGSSKSSEISISPFALPNFGYGWVNGTILKEVPSSLAIMTSLPRIAIASSSSSLIFASFDVIRSICIISNLMTGYTIIVFSISSNLITPRLSSKNCIFEPHPTVEEGREWKAQIVHVCSVVSQHLEQNSNSNRTV